MKRNKLNRKFRRNLIVSLMTLNMIQGMSSQAMEVPEPPPNVPLPPGVPPPPGYVPPPPGVPLPPGAGVPPFPVFNPAVAPKVDPYKGPQGKVQKKLEEFYKSAGNDDEVKGSLQEQVKKTLAYISSEWAPSYIKDYVDFGDQGLIGGRTEIKISKEYLNKHLEALTTIVDAPADLTDDDKKKILKNFWEERDYKCGQMVTNHKVIMSELPEAIDPNKTDKENEGRISLEKYLQYSAFRRPWAQPAKIQVFFFKIKINDDKTCEPVDSTSIEIPSAVFSVFPKNRIKNETSGNKSCSGMRFYYDESEKEVLQKKLQEFQMKVIDEYDANKKICDKSANENPFRMNDKQNLIIAPALNAEKKVGKGKKQQKAEAKNKKAVENADEKVKKEIKEIIEGANNAIQEDFKKLVDKGNDVEKYKIVEKQINAFKDKMDLKLVGPSGHIDKMRIIFNEVFKEYANIKDQEVRVDYKDVWFSINGKLSYGAKTEKDDKEFYKKYNEYQKEQKKKEDMAATLAEIKKLNETRSNKKKLRADDLYVNVEKPKETAKKKDEKYPKKGGLHEKGKEPFKLPELKKNKFENVEKVAEAKAEEDLFLKELKKLSEKSKGFEFKPKEKERDNGDAFFANLKKGIKQRKMPDPAADLAADPATQKTQNPNFGNFGETGCGQLKEQLKNLCQKSNNPEGMNNILTAIKSSTGEATKSLTEYLNKNLGSLDNPKPLGENVNLVYKAQPHNYAFDYCDITNDRDKRQNAATTNIPRPAALAKAEFRKPIGINPTEVDIGGGDKLVCKPAHFVPGTLTVPVEYCRVDEKSNVVKETLTFKVPFAVVKAQDDKYDIVYGFNDENIDHLEGLADKVHQLQTEDVQKSLLNDPKNQIRPRLETIPGTTKNLLCDVYSPIIRKLEPNLKTYKKKLAAIQKQAANGKNPANPNPNPAAAAKPNAKTQAEIQDEDFFNRMLPTIKDNVKKKIKMYQTNNQEFLKSRKPLEKYNYYQGLVETIHWCRHSVVSNLLYSHQNEPNTEGTPEHALRPNKAAFEYFGIKENEKIDINNFHVGKGGNIQYSTDKAKKRWDDSIVLKLDKAKTNLTRLRKYEAKKRFAAGKTNNGIKTFEDHVQPIIDKEKARLAQLEKEKEEREKKEKEKRERKEKEEREKKEKEEREKKEKEEKEKKEREDKKKAGGKLDGKKVEDVKGADAKRKEEVKKETVTVKQLRQLTPDEKRAWELYGVQSDDDTLYDASGLFPNIELFKKKGLGEIKPEDEKEREEQLKKKKEELEKKVEKLKLETDKSAKKFVENKFNTTAKKEEPKVEKPKVEEPKKEAEAKEEAKEEVKEEVKEKVKEEVKGEVKEETKEETKEEPKEEPKEETGESDKGYDDLANAWSITDTKLMETQRELRQKEEELDKANNTISEQSEQITELKVANKKLQEDNENLEKEKQTAQKVAAAAGTVGFGGTAALAAGATTAGREVLAKVAPKLTRDIAARLAANAIAKAGENAAQEVASEVVANAGEKIAQKTITNITANALKNGVKGLSR